jgi:hypothetical protein
MMIKEAGQLLDLPLEGAENTTSTLDAFKA